MPKNIVFCADGSWSHPAEIQDGTWNYPDKPKDSTLGTTNVYKIYDALTPSPTQVTFYDDGVGTKGSFIQRVLGGAFGEGLFDKIKDGYSNIAQTYREGDSIHLFGFSRGAYTVRSLAGMIGECGLPEPGRFSEAALEDAFAAYRERDPVRKHERLADLKKKYGNRVEDDDRQVKIAEIGVWDTVGSMGIPGNLFEAAEKKRYDFLDTKLHPNVEAAWHALAIDEHRKAFTPTLFEKSTPHQQLDQVWFAGVHGDVGGGTKEPGLSDIPLGWMMKKAASKGLVFDPLVFRKYTELPQESALIPMDQSKRPLFDAPLNPIWGGRKIRSIPPDATIADSVVTRMQEMPGYRPPNLEPKTELDQKHHLLIPSSMQIEDVLAAPRVTIEPERKWVNLTTVVQPSPHSL